MKKKKFIFVSPFERYKRVIPMIAEEEAREREKQKQEEENRLEKLKEAEEEIAESKKRVFEHFKQVSEDIETHSSTKRPSKAPLSQMKGFKRKRGSNIDKEQATQEVKTNDSLLTSVPSLETKIVQGVNKETNETSRFSREQNMQESIVRFQNNNVTNSIR